MCLARWNADKETGQHVAYTTVEAKEGVIPNDVHESTEHPFRAIGRSGLEANLATVSAL